MFEFFKKWMRRRKLRKRVYKLVEMVHNEPEVFEKVVPERLRQHTAWDSYYKDRLRRLHVDPFLFVLGRWSDRVADIRFVKISEDGEHIFSSRPDFFSEPYLTHIEDALDQIESLFERKWAEEKAKIQTRLEEHITTRLERNKKLT